MFGPRHGAATCERRDRRRRRIVWENLRRHAVGPEQVLPSVMGAQAGLLLVTPVTGRGQRVQDAGPQGAATEACQLTTPLRGRREQLLSGVTTLGPAGWKETQPGVEGTELPYRHPEDTEKHSFRGLFSGIRFFGEINIGNKHPKVIFFFSDQGEKRQLLFWVSELAIHT